MNPLWDFFWPIFAAGIMIGAVTGHLAFRQLGTRKIYFGGGGAAAVAAALLWSGPLGGADRLASRIETPARATLDHLEMTRVSARLERSPMRRRLILSGPADEFQRGQLVQILDDIRGVAGVRWASPPQPSDGAK